MQETWVQSLGQEDPTCPRAAKPVCHRYQACALELVSCNGGAHVPQLLKSEHPRACALQQEKPPQWETHAPLLEKSQSSNEDPTQRKINNKIIKKKFKKNYHMIQQFHF